MGGAGVGSARISHRYGVVTGVGSTKLRYYGVQGGWDGRSLFLETDAAPVRRSKGPSPSGVVGRVRARGITQSL